jgi:hypothetical protein
MTQYVLPVMRKIQMTDKAKELVVRIIMFLGLKNEV